MSKDDKSVASTTASVCTEHDDFERVAALSDSDDEPDVDDPKLHEDHDLLSTTRAGVLLPWAVKSSIVQYLL